MKPLPLLILFANFKGNLGDFAIFHAMLETLENRYPGREKHVFSLGHKEVDATRLASFIAEPHPPFILVGRSPYRRVKGIPQWFKHAGLDKWLAGKWIDRLSREFTKSEPISSAGDYEAIFLAGGEQWGGYSTGINQFAILDAVSRVNRNVFIFPFSVRKKLLDSYSHDRLESLFKRIAGDRVVRDGGSGETLRSVCPAVLDGADCVFSLASREIAGPPPTEALVILAVTQAENSSRDELVTAIHRLTAGGIRVRLLTTCECEDGPVLSELSRTLGIDFVAPATWQETVEEFRSASLVVTNRLHCMVFSFFAGVPVVPLRNREKVTGICTDAGLTRWVDSIGALTPELALACIADREWTLEKMRAYREKVSQLPMGPWEFTPASE